MVTMVTKDSDYFSGYIIYGPEGVVFSIAPFCPSAGLRVERSYRKNGVNSRDWLNLCDSCPLQNHEPDYYYTLTIGGTDFDMSRDDLEYLARNINRIGFRDIADAILELEPSRVDDYESCYDFSLFESHICPYGQIREIEYTFTAQSKSAITAFLLYSYNDTGLIPYQVELIPCDNGDTAVTLYQIELGFNQYADGSLCSNASNIFDWIPDVCNSDIPPTFENGWDFTLDGTVLKVSPGYCFLGETKITPELAALPLDQFLLSTDFIGFLHRSIEHDGAPNPDEVDSYTIVDV